MSAQNTHHILAFYHVFGSFQLVISVFIALYMILDFLCISGEKGGIWRMCGDLKKEIGEPSLNVATSPGLSQREFQIRRKMNKKKKNGERGERGRRQRRRDLRNRVIPVFVFSFSNSF